MKALYKQFDGFRTNYEGQLVEAINPLLYQHLEKIEQLRKYGLDDVAETTNLLFTQAVMKHIRQCLRVAKAAGADNHTIIEAIHDAFED